MAVACVSFSDQRGRRRGSFATPAPPDESRGSTDLGLQKSSSNVPPVDLLILWLGFCLDPPPILRRKGFSRGLAREASLCPTCPNCERKSVSVSSIYPARPQDGQADRRLICPGKFVVGGAKENKSCPELLPRTGGEDLCEGTGALWPVVRAVLRPSRRPARRG